VARAIKARKIAHKLFDSFAGEQSRVLPQGALQNGEIPFSQKTAKNDPVIARADLPSGGDSKKGPDFQRETRRSPIQRLIAALIGDASWRIFFVERS